MPTPGLQASVNYDPNKTNGAPAGYYYDQVQGRYLPTAGSPSDQLTQRTREQGFEDQAGQFAGQDQADKQQLFGTILGGLNNPQGSMFGIGGAGAPSPYTGGGYNIPPPVSATTGPGADQLKASNDAAFATAKDEAANTTQAAMQGLQGDLQARGMGGAGYEAGQVGHTLANEADQIGAASRQNAGVRYDQNLTRANVDTQAQVAQRGQTIGAEQAQAGDALTARGQDINAATAAAQRKSSALQGLLGAVRY